jgi:hypothetical protein
MPDFNAGGLSFQPGLQSRFRASLNNQVSPGISEALQILSLRLPQFLGGSPIAPDALLGGRPLGGPTPPPIVGGPPQTPPPSPNVRYNQPTPPPTGPTPQSTPTGPSPATPVSATPGVDRGFVYTPPSPVDNGPITDPGTGGGSNTAPPNPNWIFQRPGAAPAPAATSPISDLLSQLFGPVPSSQYDPGSGFDNRTGSPQI